MPRLIYIDSSFSYETIQQRKLHHVLIARELGGFFEKVWSVHPIDTHPALAARASQFGRPLVVRVGERHEFIRGRIARFRSLQGIPWFNTGLALLSLSLLLVRLAIKNKVEFVRAGDPLLSGFIAWTVAKLAGAKLIIRVNGDNENGRRSTGEPIFPRLFPNTHVEQMVERFVLKRADLVLIPNLYYGAFARRSGVEDRKIHLVRYGDVIDPVHFVEPDQRKVDGALPREIMLSKEKWIIHVGRLFKIKHVEDCYEVLRQLQKRSVEANLLYVGDGPLRTNLEQRAMTDGLQERVKFVGNLDQETLAMLIPMCSVALSPHTGRALAEVALGQLPIVAYDLEWQGELVQDKVSGILVPRGDITAMAEATQVLLTNQSLAAEFGKAARERALEMMDTAEQMRRERRAYEFLVEK